jgi:hypothetical protein
MKHFWIQFDNPLKNGRFELEFLYIHVEFNDKYSEIRLIILNVVFQYLRPKGKL